MQAFSPRVLVFLTTAQLRKSLLDDAAVYTAMRIESPPLSLQSLFKGSFISTLTHKPIKHISSSHTFPLPETGNLCPIYSIAAF